MLLRSIIKSRYQAILVTLAIVFLLNASLKSIFFGSDKEIIYNYSTVVFLCLKDSEICAYSSELKLANTGLEKLTDISVNFSDIPSTLSASLSVRDLNAGKPRDTDPNIYNYDLTDGNSIKMSNLTPGTMVVVKFSGSVPINKKNLLTELGINVESNANVINADPQGTEFVRLWSFLL